MPGAKRMLWLDIAKGFAISCVVLGHCLSDTTALHDWVYSFHMPLFFALAGFTMRAKPRAEVFKSSFRRLLIPYFIVCGILLLFALVPPSSLNSSLDTQRSLPVVLVEAFYASGQEGQIAGHTFQAIGAIWFLPCLFWGRLVLNEILLRTAGLKGARRLAEPALVLLLLFAGFAIGNEVRLPFDLDTAFVAVFFMYVGLLAKRHDITKLRWWQWGVIVAVWMLYLVVGSNEMAVRAYLQHPLSVVTASAGSLSIMGGCMLVERIPAKRLLAGVAWLGTSSLTVLCVHRVESAIFNWQKIMEFFVPGVWSWDVLAQGLYWFALRFALVVVATIVVVTLNKAVRAKVAKLRARG